MIIDLENPAEPIDISIPLHFNGSQPNAFGVDAATATFLGDTRDGSSVNFEQYTFIPHCNGTHTECVGHITDERISVLDCLRDVFVAAVLVSVEPENVDGELLVTANLLRLANESEPPALAGGVDVEQNATSGSPAYAGGSDKALVVRTLPNDHSKFTRRYGEGNIPPYFTAEAMEYIVACGFRHLLVDMPSIDRIFDEGRLVNHRIFWNVEPESREVNVETRINNTITELIYVPNEVVDGRYLLNLQIAPFVSDAAPSRPVLFLSEPPA